VEKTAHRSVKSVAMLVEIEIVNNRKCRRLEVFTFVVLPSCSTDRKRLCSRRFIYFLMAGTLTLYH